jgi:hypothetical protein
LRKVVSKTFVRHPKKTFSTLSANSGHSGKPTKRCSDCA